MSQTFDNEKSALQASTSSFVVSGAELISYARHLDDFYHVGTNSDSDEDTPNSARSAVLSEDPLTRIFDTMGHYEKIDAAKALRASNKAAVKSGLDPRANAFIPNFNPSVSKVMVADLVKDMDKHDVCKVLESKGYPTHWIRQFASDDKKRISQLKEAHNRRMRSEEIEEGKRTVVLAKYNFVPSSGKKTGGNFWRVPIYRGSHVIDKPSISTLSQKGFKAWVHGVAWLLSSQLKRKTQYVTGNMSAQCLYFSMSSVTTLSEMTRLLESATIFVADYAVRDSVPSLTTIADVLADKLPRSLVIGMTVVHSVNELETLAALFKRHKPLFTLAYSYLSRTESADFNLELLQQSIRDKVKPVVVARYEGNGVSVKVTHDVSDTAVAQVQAAAADSTRQIAEELRSVVSDSITLLGDQVGKTYVRSGIQVASFIVALSTADSFTNALAVITQFCSGNDQIWSFFSERIGGYQGSQVYMYEGFGSEVVQGLKQWFWEIYDIIVSTSLLTIFQEATAEFRQYLLGPMCDLVKSVRFSLMKEAGSSIAKVVLAGLTEAIARLKSCVVARSFTPMWGSNWDPRRWLKHTNGLMTNYIVLTTMESVPGMTTPAALVEKDEIPSGWNEPVSSGDFLSRGRLHLDQGVALRSYFAKNDIIARDLTHLINSFTAFCCEIVTAGLVGSMRIAPISLFLTGETSVGKTNVARMILKAIARKHHYDSNRGIHDWMMNSNFQEGFTHESWGVVMDDVDHSVAPPSAGFKNHIESFLELKNNKPFMIEQADVRMKGRVKANPLVLMLLSNFKDSRVKSNSLYPDAFFRRIDAYVRVEVKAEYRKEGSHVLDEDKVRAAGTHDIYDLYVRRFDPSKVKTVRTLNGNHGGGLPFTDETRFSFPAFVKWYLDLFEEHLAEQRNLVARFAQETGVCPICYLDTDKECGHRREGNPMIVAGLVASTFASIVFRKRIIRQYQDWNLQIPAYSPRNTHYSVNNIDVMLDRVGEAYKTQGAKVAAAVSLTVVTAASLAVWFARKYIQEFEGRELNQIDGFAPMNWVRADQKFQPGVPALSLNATFTKDDILRCIKECIVSVQGPVFETYGFLVGHNLVLAPTHAIKMNESGVIEISGRKLHFSANGLNCEVLPSNPELCLLRHGELKGTRNISNYIWAYQDEGIATFDEGELINAAPLFAGLCVRVKTLSGVRVLEYVAPTQKGDCGSLVLGRFNKSWWIVGMHYMGLDMTSLSGSVHLGISGIITRSELAKVASRVASSLEGVVTAPHMLSRHPEIAACTPLPYKSEVWAAMSYPNVHPYCFGELSPRLSGSTMKTKIKRSILAKYFEDLEAKWCGKPNYWLLPNFRGKMDGDRWSSPYTDAFLHISDVSMDEEISFVAIADYLSGIDELDPTGYGFISEEQALAGVPNSIVRPVNLKTSMGPPYVGPKRQHYSVGNGMAAMSPEAAKILDEIEAIHEAGFIPAPVGVATLKDEALKEGKLPRVFINLSSGFNADLKKIFSGFMSFLRAYPFFFECMVGINMTSADCNKLVAFMKTVCPSLDELWDGDAVRLDKSWSGDKWDKVCLIIYGVCFYIYGKVLALRAYRSACGMKHTRYSMKNDIFSTFWNPSGGFITVELNSILMSWLERFVYYSTVGIPKGFDVKSYAAHFFDNPIPSKEDSKLFTFRKNNALMTYGDDNIKATNYPLRPDYCAFWREKIGIVMTDASKSDHMKKKELKDIEFLKRKFVLDRELGMYVAQLSLKSMARTLVIKKDSSLSDLDHAAVAMTEVLREAMYHGKPLYNYLRYRFHYAAHDMGIERNPYFVCPHYSVYRKKMIEGSFKTWEVYGDPVPPVIEVHNGKVFDVSFEGKMSKIQLVNGGNDPAKNDEVVQTTTNLTHGTGQLQSDSTLQTTQNAWTPHYFQNVPDTSLGDFPLRLTEITEVVLSTTDVDESLIIAFDPWDLYLGNPRVEEKMANFSLIRGTMELVGITSAPGNAYGSYVVSALPNGGSVPSTATTQEISPELHVENCMQVDNYTRLDCANSENFVIHLPFLWPYDFAQLPDGPANSWRIYVTCLSAIRSAMPGAVGTAMHVKFFARLLPDYKLTVPHIEGHQRHSGRLRPSENIKKFAPHLQSIAEHPAAAQVGAAVSAHVPEQMKGKVSGVADAVGNVADKLSGIPVIGGTAAAVSGVAHAASKLAKFFGMTYEEAELSSIPITQRSVSNVAHIDGQDRSELASLVTGNAINIDPQIAGCSDKDCMATSDIYNRWTLVKSFDWNIGSETGDILGNWPISPSYCRDAGGMTHLTTAGYVGFPFNLWRGDMEYLIVAPASKLHRGSVQFFWVPYGGVLPSTVTNTTLNFIYDVTAGGEKQFTVGFARDLPFLQNRILSDQYLIVPTGATNGTMYARVINPLYSPAETNPVTFFIFARACANMEFAVLKRQSLSLNATLDGLVDNPWFVSASLEGATGDEDDHEADTLALVAPSGIYPSDQILFGEKFESVRGLMQKPNRIFQDDNTWSTINYAPILGVLRGSAGATAGWNTSLTLQGLYRQLFTGLACSERYKMFPEVGSWLGAEGWNTGSITDTSPMSFVGPLAPMTFCGANKGGEFQIPYYTAKKYMLTRYMYRPTLSTGIERVNILHFHKRTSESSNCVIYHSYAPDMRVTCFRQVPILVLPDTQLSPVGYPAWFVSTT
jgi:hypothetical protein